MRPVLHVCWRAVALSVIVLVPLAIATACTVGMRLLSMREPSIPPVSDMLPDILIGWLLLLALPAAKVLAFNRSVERSMSSVHMLITGWRLRRERRKSR